MDALAFQGVEVGRQRGHQGLAFAGGPFRRCYRGCRTMPPKICTSKCRMFLVRKAASRQAANASRQQLFKGSTTGEPVAELRRQPAELLVAQGVHLLFMRVDLRQKHAGHNPGRGSADLSCECNPTCGYSARCWSRASGSGSSTFPSENEPSASPTFSRKLTSMVCSVVIGLLNASTERSVSGPSLGERTAQNVNLPAFAKNGSIRTRPGCMGGTRGVMATFKRHDSQGSRLFGSHAKPILPDGRLVKTSTSLFR